MKDGDAIRPVKAPRGTGIDADHGGRPDGRRRPRDRRPGRRQRSGRPVRRPRRRTGRCPRRRCSIGTAASAGTSPRSASRASPGIATSRRSTATASASSSRIGPRRWVRPSESPVAQPWASTRERFKYVADVLVAGGRHPPRCSIGSPWRRSSRAASSAASSPRASRVARRSSRSGSWTRPATPTSPPVPARPSARRPARRCSPRRSCSR